MPSKKVLLVDNDVEYQALITNALEPANYRITMFLDGESGFQGAKKDRPDLIIISVELPDSNGYLLCKRFREEESLKKVPVILISKDAKPKDFDQHRKLKIRADEYMLKPFSEEVILSKVQNLIGFHITEKEFELMQEHLNSMIQEKIALDDRITTLERDNNQMKTQLDSMADTEQELKAVRQRETELQKQLKENKEHTNVIDKWLTEANDTIKKLQMDNEKLSRENGSVKATFDAVRKQLKDLNDAYSALQNSVKKSGTDAEKIRILLNQAASMLPKE